MNTNVLLIAFIVFAIIICVFVAIVVIKDMADGSRKRKNEEQTTAQNAQNGVYFVPVQFVPQGSVPVQQEVVKPAEPAKTEPAAEQKKETVAEETGTAATLSANAVTFESSKSQTLSEKYAELSKEKKGYYDEIVKYASAVNGARQFKNDRYEEYKLGSSRIVRLLIKRGTVVCEFILPNSEFKNFVNENKVNVRLNATVMKIEDKVALDTAKGTIDLVLKAIAEEKEYKKQLAKERRKAKRQAEKAE